MMVFYCLPSKKKIILRWVKVSAHVVGSGTTEMASISDFAAQDIDTDIIRERQVRIIAKAVLRPSQIKSASARRAVVKRTDGPPDFARRNLRRSKLGSTGNEADCRCRQLEKFRPRPEASAGLSVKPIHIIGTDLRRALCQCCCRPVRPVAVEPDSAKKCVSRKIMKSIPNGSDELFMIGVSSRNVSETTCTNSKRVDFFANGGGANGVTPPPGVGAPSGGGRIGETGGKNRCRKS